MSWHRLTKPQTQRRRTWLQFQYDLKGISFLPRLDAGAYPQMPYQEITEAQYQEVRVRAGILLLSVCKCMALADRLFL